LLRIDGREGADRSPIEKVNFFKFENQVVGCENGSGEEPLALHFKDLPRKSFIKTINIKKTFS
jgi:hypothetical protein